MSDSETQDKLYIGSGTWQKEGWLNHHCSKLHFYNAAAKYFLGKSTGEFEVDGDELFSFDLDHDLCDSECFPIRDGSLSVVYSSHTIEHIRNCDAAFVFQDVYRMLKNSGVFRVTCPDINLLFDRLITDREKLGDITLFEVPTSYDEFIWATFTYFSAEFRIRDTYLFDSIPDGHSVYSQYLSETKVDETEFRLLLDTYGRFGTFENLRHRSELLFEKYRYHITTMHVNWWTVEKVCHYLFEAGFSKVNIVSQNKSSLKCFESKDFDYCIPHVSLFVEAIK